jgi:hypothetical protein
VVNFNEIASWIVDVVWVNAKEVVHGEPMRKIRTPVFNDGPHYLTAEGGCEVTAFFEHQIGIHGSPNADTMLVEDTPVPKQCVEEGAVCP